MKRILTVLILFFATTGAFADSYNAIAIQGVLTPPTTIYGVGVDIWSGGDIVGEGSDIDLIPDADGIFVTKTYISNPKIFLTGSDYIVSLSSPDATVISSFSITAVPFALTVRGDAQTGDQNVFGAYGNVGIGTAAPSYRLVISSGAGTSGDMLVISTGTSNVIRMTGAGEVYASKFIGDGSELTNLGVEGTGDNLGNHIATTTLQMAGNSIYNASTITATGYITAASYQIGGTTLLAVSPDYISLSLGGDAGRVDNNSYNTFIGHQSGNHITSGYENTFVGKQAGFSNTNGGQNTYIGVFAGLGSTTGGLNTFVGELAGSNNNGSYNTFIGNDAGSGNSAGSGNTFIGYYAGGDMPGSYNIAIGELSGIASSSYSMDIGGLLYGDLFNKTVGIGGWFPQQAALDVLSTGTASNQFVQIWRDSSGVIKASMSATGVMMADKFIGNGSELEGISGDNLGNHTATTGLNMAENQITNASSITVTGNAFSVGGSTLVVANGKVGISSAVPTEVLSVQGNVNISGDYYKNGVALPTTNDLLSSTNIWTGGQTFIGSMTVAADGFSVGGSTLVVANGKVGISSAVPTEVLSVQGNVNISGDYYKNGAPLSGDNLGDHTATQALNMSEQQIINVSSITVSSKDASGYSLSLSSGINMPDGTVTAGLFNGSGASLTGLNASNLTNGTVADARLSSNVDRLDADQSVIGAKTFTGTVTLPTRDKVAFGNELHNSSAAISLPATDHTDTTYMICDSTLSITTHGNSRIGVHFSQTGGNNVVGKIQAAFYRLDSGPSVKGPASHTNVVNYYTPVYIDNITDVVVSSGIHTICTGIGVNANNYITQSMSNNGGWFWIEEIR